MLILQNCTLVQELTQSGLKKADILVEHGRISQVLAPGAHAPQPADEAVNCNGKVVVPGFFDLHVHLCLSSGDVLEDNRKSPAAIALEARRHALASLQAGFTTLRDVGAYFGAAVALRDAVNAGLEVGPRILASAKIVTPTENGNDFFAEMYTEADGADAFLAACRGEFQAGADFIKIMATGAIMNPGGEPGCPICTDAEISAAVQAAQLKNSYVAAHAHGARGISQCVRCGVRTIEHASLIDEAGIELLKNNTESFIVPTVSAIAAPDAPGDEWPDFLKAKADSFLGSFTRCLKAAYAAGLKMGFATDQGICNLPHGQNGLEFTIRRDLLGMAPLDILLQATKYSAEIIGLGEVAGTIDPGKYADLVVLNADPLQDIAACRDSIHQVYKGGIAVN